MHQLFFELIRVALGTQNTLSRALCHSEWEALYNFAKKQSLVGICFAGIQRLPEDVRPSEMLYLTWMGMAAKIQQRNQTVDEQCVNLQKRLSADGLRLSVLKGQGVGRLYAEHLLGLRQSGDIDLWIAGDYQQTIDYLKKKGVAAKVTANHVEANFFDETEVEVHPIPAIFRNPLTNRKWKKFCKEHETECMTNKVCLYDNDGFDKLTNRDDDDNTGICVPTTDFNLVFLMVHMYQHLLREGIGLRQFLDYFFCLKALRELSQINRKLIVNTISALGMKRFAAGVLDIMHNVFGMQEEELLCEPDPEAGAELLCEIMTGGNFGHYDERNKVTFDNASNPIHRVWNGIKRNRRFLKYGFWEIAWSPIWRLWHFCWMKKNGYR